MEIPGKIREIINKKCGNQCHIGLSGASVYIYDDVVLKIQPISDESIREVNMLHWLKNKLPVPKIIECINANKLSYLLMEKCTGLMACSQEYMIDPITQAKSLANALHDLWDLDWQDCPCQNTLDQKLKQAEYNVINGLVDTDDCEPDTYKEFRDPEALLYWLQCNRPSEELVISHGDFCLPNVLFDNGVLSGLIDLGQSGVADKWCDVALCYRSIRDNFSGRYGQCWNGYRAHYLFEALQIKPDWEKIRYYILLDELF